jgi:hypothetical protein
VSVENKCAHEPDDCPHCKRPFEITAVSIHFLRGTSFLFVCPNCGLARPESLVEARRKRIKQIPALGRIFWKLKSRPERS